MGEEKGGKIKVVEGNKQRGTVLRRGRKRGLWRIIEGMG